jgi:SAM-dependent methyltransferase
MTALRPYTNPYLLQAEREWIDALRGGKIAQLGEVLAGEIAAYTGEDLAEVKAKMQGGTDAFAQLWRESGVDRTDAESLRQFYNAGFTEAYELMHWHSGGLGRCPVDYVLASWIARQVGARRVLDFGSGVGSGAIFLAGCGLEVSLADISAPLLDFCRARLVARGINGPTYLLPKERLPRRAFDLVTCMDVIEHVPDPVATIDEIASYLRVGGVLVAVLYENSECHDRPMHISSCGNLSDFAQQTSMWVDWPLTQQISQWGGECAVLRKLPAGRVLRRIEAIGRQLGASRAMALAKRGLVRAISPARGRVRSNEMVR